MFDDGAIVHVGHTRGKNLKFEWTLTNQGIAIRSEKGKVYVYSEAELASVLMWLYCSFGQTPFPLANNLELLEQGTEQNGFGLALYSVKRQNAFVQAAMYLALVFESLGVFEHIKGSPIQWTLKVDPKKGFVSLLDRLKG